MICKIRRTYWTLVAVVKVSIFYHHLITLFTSITMFRGTDNVSWNVPKYFPHSDWIQALWFANMLEGAIIWKYAPTPNTHTHKHILLMIAWRKSLEGIFLQSRWLIHSLAIKYGIVHGIYYHIHYLRRPKLDASRSLKSYFCYLLI